MLRINCPFCGPRDEVEFRYRGDASVLRPEPTASIEAFAEYVYTRENRRGWQVEWWQHAHGCRKVIKLVRHVMTHEIAFIGWPDDILIVPEAEEVG